MKEITFEDAKALLRRDAWRQPLQHPIVHTVSRFGCDTSLSRALADVDRAVSCWHLDPSETPPGYDDHRLLMWHANDERQWRVFYAAGGSDAPLDRDPAAYGSDIAEASPAAAAEWLLGLAGEESHDGIAVSAVETRDIARYIPPALGDIGLVPLNAPLTAPLAGATTATVASFTITAHGRTLRVTVEDVP